MTQIERILVATDFSQTATAALEFAQGLAEKFGAELHLVHVYPLLMYALGEDLVPDDPRFEERLREQLQKKLDATLAEQPAGLTVEAHLLQGNPWREIPKLAEQVQAQLVVMGTHGRTGIKHVVLGSVAERTLRHSSVPVLTVPGPPGAS